jgi:hypothetical protein
MVMAEERIAIMKENRTNFKAFFIVSLPFFCALMARLFYVAMVPAHPIPHFADDAYYNNTAHAIYGILQHSNIVFEELLKGGLGQGGGILDQYGLILPFGVFHRGLIHPVFLAVIYFFTSLDHFKAVWFVQALLDSFTCLLIYIIGARVFSKKTGFCAALVAAFYVPLIHATATLLQETLIIFLLVSAVYFLIKGMQDKSWWSFSLAGTLLFLVTTGRLALMYLFLILFAGIVFLCWVKRQDCLSAKRKVFMALALGFGLPLMLWMGLVSLEFGQFGKIMVGPGAANLYLSNITALNGWWPDDSRGGIGPRTIEHLKAEGFFWDDKKNQEPPDRVMYRAAWQQFAKQPIAYCRVLFQKAHRLWLIKINYDPLTRFFHCAMVLMAVVGIPLAFFKNKYSILLSGTILYVAFIHMLVAADIRYNLPAMPFIFLFACYALNYIFEELKTCASRMRILILSVSAMSVVSYLVWQMLCVPISLLFFKSFSPWCAVMINVGLNNIFILSLAVLVYVLFLSSLTKNQRFVAATFVYLCFFVLLNSWDSNAWRPWFVSLTDTNRAIRQTIGVPKKFLDAGEEAILQIDMEQVGDSIGRLDVYVNGELLREYDQKLQVDRNPYPLYFVYPYLIPEPAKMRRWFSVPVDMGILRKQPVTEINIQYAKMGGHNHSGVRIYGDYPVSLSGAFFEGPLFAKSDFETSHVKCIQDGDYRIGGKVALMSFRSTSEYFHDGEWAMTDLSETMGVQRGEFRIRLEIIGRDGYSRFF